MVNASCVTGEGAEQVCIQGMIPEGSAAEFDTACVEEEMGTPGTACPTEGASGTCTLIDDMRGVPFDMVFYNLDAQGVSDSEALCTLLEGTWSTP
jgi:hypothetical protein